MAVTTGRRLPDGARETNTVHCATHTTTTGEPRLYRITDAVTLLNLSRSNIYDLIRTGRLRTVTQGRARRIPATALNEYIHLLEHEAGQAT
ncbi:helix-turn-helix domain-containing protein [Streptomyces sp. SBT349]|uniref:helix-turn-helix domain-containing protein n=1 Tax=Streptomyces sp. SBT349 TaxID=1580539 RepID=UPI00066B7943|nr:helix-turn-helix domain-containing protein [Streptomyces sp. SBT349]